VFGQQKKLGKNGGKLFKLWGLLKLAWSFALRGSPGSARGRGMDETFGGQSLHVGLECGKKAGSEDEYTPLRVRPGASSEEKAMEVRI